MNLRLTNTSRYSGKLFIFFILIILVSSTLDSAAQRRRKNKVSTGILSTGIYTNSSFGPNLAVNYNINSGYQSFSAGLLFVTKSEILSGANINYHYQITENPRLFSSHPVKGLSFYGGCSALWRAVPITLLELDKDYNFKGRKTYINSLEFFIEPGLRYWFNKVAWLDFEIGGGCYLNTPPSDRVMLKGNKGDFGIGFKTSLGFGFVIK
jgi:hypothetical protein